MLLLVNKTMRDLLMSVGQIYQLREISEFRSCLIIIVDQLCLLVRETIEENVKNIFEDLVILLSQSHTYRRKKKQLYHADNMYLSNPFKAKFE